jgi:hypothetical protein
MAFVYNLFNGGTKPKLRTGLVAVNSLNRYPTTLVATAGGTQLGLELIDNYEYFVGAQTSAGTDVLLLPDAPIGTKIFIFANSIFRIKAGANGSGRGINAGADTTSIPTVASALIELTRVSASNWVATQFAAAGTVTAPTPA